MTTITQATIARGTDKMTHETFYVVKSDSSETTWYTVRWNNERSQWCCNCPATCAGCKHVRAINEVLRVRRATVALSMGAGAVVAVAQLQAEEDRKLAADALAASAQEIAHTAMRERAAAMPRMPERTRRSSLNNRELHFENGILMR